MSEGAQADHQRRPSTARILRFQDESVALSMTRLTCIGWDMKRHDPEVRLACRGRVVVHDSLATQVRNTERTLEL